MRHSYEFNEVMTCIKLIRLWTDYEVIVLATIGLLRLHSAMWISRESNLTCCFHDWLSRRSFRCIGTCRRQRHGYKDGTAKQKAQDWRCRSQPTRGSGGAL